MRRVEKIETAVEPKFQEYFVDAMALPNKTDAFPNLFSVVQRPAAKTGRERFGPAAPAAQAGLSVQDKSILHGDGARHAGRLRAGQCALRRSNSQASPDQVLAWLRQLDGDSPYRISRLEHCLQTATRAENDGADDETVICALLHDIGDVLAPANHSQAAAALLAPYVGEKNLWIVSHHGLFQGYYYFHFMGQDRDAREQYREHPLLPGLCGFLRELGPAIV